MQVIAIRNKEIASSNKLLLRIRHMIRSLITISVVFLFLSCNTIQKNNQEKVTKYVDPTIGNVAQFLVPTYPTMHLPNQMLRMFPVKDDYLSDQVEAFPLHVHSHRTKGIFQMKVLPGAITEASWNAKMTIDHDLEIVHPWLYSTYLIDNDIRVSFTPGEKVAIYKFDFPDGGQRNLLFKGTDKLTIIQENAGEFRIKESLTQVTRGIFPQTRILDVYIHARLTDENGNALSKAEIDQQNGRFALILPGDAPSSVLFKYAVSYIDHDQAEFNFNTELEGVSFDELASSGEKRWEETLGQIQVKGGTDAQKRTFYTSLYRTYERMVDINEYGRYYSGFDGKVHESDRPFYIDDWIWDTYRTTHPLRTILNPELQNDILNSFTLMYEQSGWMPSFNEVFGNKMCMHAYHSSSIFIDGYRKGLKDYDVEKAYEGIRKNLMEGTFIPWRQGTPRRPIDDFYHENGYFPALKIGEEETEPQMDDFEKRQPVPVTLGISYDFWALSELADELGKDQEYNKFSVRAQDYKNLWHPGHRLFIPKDEDGEWLDINPKLDGGRGYREYYDENNGWTYAWQVQHDISGLATLLGGKPAAEARLDQLFREPLGIRKTEFYVDGGNSTGMVGQFSMGNEPSFHIPYLYNYFGAPWKTQKRTRFLLDVWFKDNIFGIPGDEDGGAMTGWVVFSSIGLYPVTPGLPYYDITSPVFEETTIKLSDGKTFTVKADGASETQKYIQKAFLNGEMIHSPFITHDQIMSGGTLELILDEFPNKEWGKHAEIPNVK
jgi:predicted alpha-1,2-mannosidase